MDRPGDCVREQRPLDAAGFAMLPGLLTPANCRAIARQVDALASSPSDPLMSRTGNELFPLRWDSELLRPVLASARRLNRIRLASGATDLRFISAYVSLKRPRSPALAWHQDWWCWDHPISRMPASPQLAVLCYLQDVALDGGALRVLPGSHLRRMSLHSVLPEAHSAEARALPRRHPAMRAQPGELRLQVRAGDAVMLDYRLLHGTTANDSDVRRDAILLSFVPHWSALPADVREHLALHPALPREGERTSVGVHRGVSLFPFVEGASRSLELNRTALFDEPA